MFYRIAAYTKALWSVLEYLLAFIFQGFDRRDMKVIIPTLAAGVLFFGGIWVWMRAEIVVVPKKEVSQWDTQEAVRRLKLAEGVFEPDANGELAMITIYESKISESGWGLLGRMRNLRKLVLKDCEITDEGLVHLSELADLKVLGLQGNLVTDKGLESLASLTKLRALDLKGTLVTNDGITWLRQALPDCNIVN